jgi:hypothetical protein
MGIRPRYHFFAVFFFKSILFLAKQRLPGQLVLFIIDSPRHRQRLVRLWEIAVGRGCESGGKHTSILLRRIGTIHQTDKASAFPRVLIFPIYIYIYTCV